MADDSVRTRQQVSIITAAFAAIATGDVEAMLENYSDDVVFGIPYSSPPKVIVGKRDVAKYLRAAFNVFRFSLAITRAFALIDPDTLIVEYVSTGNALPTGRPYANSYIAIYTFRGDLICGVKEYFNPIPAQVALGAFVSD